MESVNTGGSMKFVYPKEKDTSFEKEFNKRINDSFERMQKEIRENPIKKHDKKLKKRYIDEIRELIDEEINEKGQMKKQQKIDSFNSSLGKESNIKFEDNKRKKSWNFYPFNKYYFWLIVIINFILTGGLKNLDDVIFTGGYFIGSLLIIFLIFELINWIKHKK